MADPKARLVRGPLQNVSIAYRNKAYLADKIFPILDGVPAKAQILRHNKGDWFRDEAGMRGPGARARRGSPKTDYINATPVEYAFASEVTDEERRWAEQQGAPPLRPDEQAIGYATDKVDLKKEILTATLVKTGTWSGVAGEDAAGLWAPNDATNTFIDDVETRIETIRAATGLRPNVLVITANTLAKVKKLDAVLDRIKYTERGVVTAALIAAIFELEECLVAEAIQNTAKETKAGTEFTAADVWEKNAGKGSAFLAYRPAAPGLKTPSAGYQARESIDAGQPRRVETWRENAEHQDVYEVAESTHVVQTGADLGFFWSDTILT